MNHFDNSIITKIAAHHVGNKNNDEGITFSKHLIQTNEKLNTILSSYFLTPFKSNEYFRFYHPTDLKLNEIYIHICDIFNNMDTFFEKSIHISKYLYEQSIHPKIKSGELYTVYFKDCIVDGELTDAIGLFKSENKDVFLKVHNENGDFVFETDQGININKLDKGCIIFNQEKEKGFVISVVDHTNKNSEALYWMNQFLQVKQREDEYFYTQNILTMYSQFVKEELPQQFEINKADQVDLIQRSVEYFKEKDQFDIASFAEEVITQPEIIESFNQYKEDFSKEKDIQIAETFNISESAVKKQSKTFKSIIKLDKNFHIYVHGDRSLIQSGNDSDGRKFYKLYFQEEN
ncbi:MAG: hypothetical protein CVU04_05260 [Bacteroidetes bacterium HGW-Bacteroidetes-20]|nr:MAG: hypothetical protein CVU04_05260 [Bacteroidetes bacterium HGW-Bacteroidetes-20]